MSTSALLASLIAQVKSNQVSGASVGALLTGGLFAIMAPDSASFPHGIMRLTGRQHTGDDANVREAGRIELQMFGKPLKQNPTIEQCADLAEQALWNLSTNYGGQFDVRSLVSRDTIPPLGNPADREITQVRLVWAYSWWPDYRAQHAVTAGTAP